MIVITGAAGFIGSCLVSKFNSINVFDLILVDNFSNDLKKANLFGKKFFKKIDRDFFVDWLQKNSSKVSIVYHIGARTDTIESNVEIFNELNLFYSKKLWNICSQAKIPFIYASSAATYGMGEFGFDDDHKYVNKLKPLNPYANSKNDFDKWVLKQSSMPPYWAGFKFFNIYGPNEFHKGRMASVILHAFNQIKSKGLVKLFCSHNPQYSNGGQLRDFMYVKDVVEVLVFMMEKRESGLYNLGTGEARTFNSLAKSIFNVLEKEINISFVETPITIRHRYQYYTQAKMFKLRSIGYKKEFFSLEDGIKDYVLNYLDKDRFF